MLCTKCKKRDTCLTLCERVVKYLKANGIYGGNYQGKRCETPMEPLKLDHIASKRALQFRYGRRVNTSHPQLEPDDID